MNASELQDARVLDLLPERLRRLRGRVFALGGRVPRKPIEIVECDAYALVSEEPPGAA